MENKPMPTAFETYSFIMRHIISCITEDQVVSLSGSIESYLSPDKFPDTKNYVIIMYQKTLTAIVDHKIKTINQKHEV